MTEVQIPHAAKGIKCPLWKQDCSKVCHTCRFWQRVAGTNPNTGDQVDRWDCAIALLPLLTIEVAAQARHTGAAVESLRNEAVARTTAHRIEQKLTKQIGIT